MKNANSLCKSITRPLKARLAPIEEWIRVTLSIESHNHNDNGAWLGEVISRGLKKNQNARCFNCGKQGHLKRDFR